MLRTYHQISMGSLRVLFTLILLTFSIGLVSPAQAQKMIRCDAAGAGIDSEFSIGQGAFREGALILPDSLPGVARGGACARVTRSGLRPGGAPLAVITSVAGHALFDFPLGQFLPSSDNQCIGGNCLNSTTCRLNSRCNWQIGGRGFSGTATTLDNTITNIILEGDSFSAPEAQGTLGVARSAGGAINFIESDFTFSGTLDPSTGSVTQSIFIHNSDVLGAPDTRDTIYFSEDANAAFTISGPDASAFRVVSYPPLPRVEEISSRSAFSQEGFVRTNRPGLLIGASVPLQIAFTPTANRRYDATLTIHSDARNTEAFPVRLSGVGQGFAPSNPATMSLSVVEPSGAAGEDRTLRYEIIAPGSSQDLAAIEFEHDVAFFAPGLSVDNTTLPSEPCGTGSSLTATTSSFFNFRGGNLTSGQSCTFDVKVNVPESTAPASYRQQTSPLRSIAGGSALSSAATVTQLDVTQGPLAPTLALSFSKNPVPANDTTTLTYTFTAPDNALPLSDIEINHDVDFFSSQNIIFDVAHAPATACGGTLTYPTSNFISLRGGSLPTGGTCSFSVDVIIPKAVTAGNYQVLTSPITAKSGTSKTSVNSAAASITLNVTAPVPPKPLEASGVLETNPLPAGVESNYVLTVTNPNNHEGIDVTGGVALNVGARVPGLNFEFVSITGIGCEGNGTGQKVAPHPEYVGVTIVDGKIPAKGVCTITMKVRPDASTTPGTFPVFGFAEADFDGVEESATFNNLPSIVISDGNAPVITVPSDITASTDAGKITANVTFSISATDVEDGAITPLVNSAPTTGLASGSDFPLGVTTITVTATDSNNNKVEKNFTITIEDTEKPVLTLPANISAITQAGKATANVSFVASASDNIDGAITPTVISAPNAGLVSGSDFPVGVTTLTVSATDVAGNKAKQSFTVTVSDGEAPVITNVPARQEHTTAAGAPTFSLDVTTLGVTVSDNNDTGLIPKFTIDGKVVTGVYDFPVGDTVVNIDAMDTAGNAAIQQSFIVRIIGRPPPDTTPPNVVISVPSNSHDGSTGFVATMTFNEPVTGFIDGELTATNATVGPLTPNGGAGTIFTATIRPSGRLDVVLSVTSNVAQDLAGNNNTAAADVTIAGTIVEHTQQVISTFMQNRAGHILNNQPDITEFVSGTNKSGGGALGNLALNANESNLILAFSTSRSKVLAAMNNSHIDGNHALGGNSHAVASAIAENRISSAFEASQSSPNTSANHLGYSADTKQTENSQDTPTISYAAVPESRAGTYDIWTEIYGSRSNAGTSDSNFWVGYVGTHYFIDDSTLVGIMGQLDWADETNSALNSKAEGKGWMIGPYIAGQISDQNLFYEARVAYGKSNNDISPIGTYTDSFYTTRWLVSGKIAGSYKHNDLTINPAISVSYYQDTQESYVDANNLTIPEQTLSLGELRFGPTFSKATTLEDSTLFTPTFGITGVWNFDVNNNNASQTGIIGDDDLRARVDFGFSAANPVNGMIFTLEGFYDGIGISNYDAYGGRARVTVPLQ